MPTTDAAASLHEYQLRMRGSGTDASHSAAKGRTGLLDARLWKQTSLRGRDVLWRKAFFRYYAGHEWISAIRMPSCPAAM